MANVELIPFDVPLTQRGYRLLDRKRGVSIYRRAESKIIDLAAEGGFEAPPHKVLAVLWDYGSHARLLENVRVSRIMSRRTHRLVVYQRLDLPFLDDRDYTLQVTSGTQGTMTWLKFRVANELGPAPRDGVVRVRLHRGGWLLRPISGGKATQARYHVMLDLAGSLPRWMARRSAGDSLPELFATFARRLR